MIHLAILYVCQGLAYQLMDGLLLLHGGYVQILAHIVNPIDGTDNAGGAGAKQFQQLKKAKSNQNLCTPDSQYVINLRVPG